MRVILAPIGPAPGVERVERKQNGHGTGHIEIRRSRRQLVPIRERVVVVVDEPVVTHPDRFVRNQREPDVVPEVDGHVGARTTNCGIRESPAPARTSVQRDVHGGKIGPRRQQGGAYAWVRRRTLGDEWDDTRRGEADQNPADDESGATCEVLVQHAAQPPAPQRTT